MPQGDQESLVLDALHCFLEGYACLVSEQYPESLTHFTKAILAWESIERERWTEEVIFELVDCYEKRSLVEFHLKAWQAVIDSCQKGLSYLTDQLSDEGFINAASLSNTLLKNMSQAQAIMRVEKETLKSLLFDAFAIKIKTRLTTIEARDSHKRKLARYQFQIARWERRCGDMAVAVHHVVKCMDNLNELQQPLTHDFDSMGDCCKLLAKCFSQTGAAPILKVLYHVLSNKPALFAKFERFNTAMYVLIHSDAMKVKRLLTPVMAALTMIRRGYQLANFPVTRFSTSLLEERCLQVFDHYYETLRTHQSTLTAIIEDHPSLMRNLAYEIVQMKTRVAQVEMKMANSASFFTPSSPSLQPPASSPSNGRKPS